MGGGRGGETRSVDWKYAKAFVDLPSFLVTLGGVFCGRGCRCNCFCVAKADNRTACMEVKSFSEFLFALSKARILYSLDQLDRETA